MATEGPTGRHDPPSRDELEAAVASAFTGEHASREDLAAAAVRAVARPAVVALLRGLPARRYRGIDDVWAVVAWPRPGRR